MKGRKIVWSNGWNGLRLKNKSGSVLPRREVRERDEENKDERIRCYNCGERGHLSRSNERYQRKRNKSGERNWRPSGIESEAGNKYKSQAGNLEGPAEM